MYQGKYTKKDSSTENEPRPATKNETEDILDKELEAILFPDTAPAPTAPAPAPTLPPISAPVEKASNPARPATPASRAYPPVRRSGNTLRRKKKSKKKSETGKYIFYCSLAAYVLIFFIALIFVMNALQDWLVKFEASQPVHKQEEVYAELFSDPDWKALYNRVGITNSKFENADTFAAYMEQKVGDQELTCLETSAGLSGDKKFVIRCNNEKIATFTLTTAASEGGITEWELKSLELFYSRTNSVTVEKLPGYTVYINGVPLDDSYTVRTVSTLAENYLPEGVHGYRIEHQQVNDLLATPVVTVRDAIGNSIPVTLDAESGIYKLSTEELTPSEEEKQLAVKATKIYAEYMIGKARLSAVAELFDKNSQFYKTISTSEVGWVQSGASYLFTEPVFSNYYRYADDIFSIKLDMTLKQTRFDGTVKDYPLNNTLFFQRNAAGKWLVMEATNMDVQQENELVRLVYKNGDTIIRSEFVDSSATVLTLPEISTPEGMEFKGWGTVSKDDKGNTTITIVFNPTESGTVYLPSDNSLEPMILHAHFEEVTVE